MYDCETFEELSNSRKCFYSWLSSGDIRKRLGEGTYEKIFAYATNTIDAKQEAWAIPVIRDGATTTISCNTTSNSEAMNHSIKHGVFSTKPQQSLAASAESQVKKSKHHARKRKLEAELGAKKTNLWSKSDTSAVLTDYAESLSCLAMDRRTLYGVVKGACWVLVVVTYLMFTCCRYIFDVG